jgi:hypothetical protein
MSSKVNPQKSSSLRNRLRWGATWALPIFAFGIVACGSDSTGPDSSKTCRELGAELRAANSGSDPVYKDLSPNGGESFKVGDTLKIKVIAANGESDALIRLRVEDNQGGPETAVWPGQTEGFNLQDSCEFSLVLPDTLSAGSRRVNLISSKVKIQVENYQSSLIFDRSDDYFSIQAD